MKKNTGIISEINMIPFVDIMLVLLIVFIIAQPFSQKQLPIQLPSVHKKTLADIKKRHYLYLFIKASGLVIVSSRADQMGHKWRPFNKAFKGIKRKTLLSSEFVVYGDKKLSFQRLMNVISFLHKHQVKKIHLAARES
jgi:biopolymer transport protein ExbD